MNIVVKNLKQNKKLKIKADMEFSLVALVQLWEKLEDAKPYLGRLSGRISESHYCTRWEKLISKSLVELTSVSEEVSQELRSFGAFNAIHKIRGSNAKNTKEVFKYDSASGNAPRAQAKGS